VTEQPQSAGDHARSIGHRAVTIAIWLAVALALVLVGSSVLPRWWSHRIGDQVSGSITAGIVLGLFYGFVFTIAPLTLLWLTFRKRRTWKTVLTMVGVAVVLAAPNLLTLGIVLGSGNAAHAGERTFDVEAPDFRASSLAGAIVAVCAVGGLAYLLGSRRRSKEREVALRHELEEVKAPHDTAS